MPIDYLSFHPFCGISSYHLQTILPTFLPKGKPPPSRHHLISLGDGDTLSLEISTPKHWRKSDPSVVLVHGMGGCDSSRYMVRVARKLYAQNIKTVRVNLRGAGCSRSKMPYHAGTSFDILRLLEVLKEESPASLVSVIGFSLGGNVVLKLAGELGDQAKTLARTFIAVCAPIDLADAVHRIEAERNRIYHFYYLKKLCKQARPWGDWTKTKSLSQLDEKLTVPLWGYLDRNDYYQQCSSIRFLSNIRQKTHLLFSQDDPFVRWEPLREISIPSEVHISIASGGGHMGFLGSMLEPGPIHGADPLIIRWALD